MPLWAQFQDLLRDAILIGDLPAGTQLPSEDFLGQRYGLSRLTVRRAFQDLQREGLIRTERGRGSIVDGVAGERVGTGISLIMSQLHHVFHVDLIRGVEKTVKHAGYHLVTRFSRNDPAEERRDIVAALRDQDAGVLLFPTVGFENADVLRSVIDRGLPVTFIDRWYPGLAADSVSEDNVHGGYLATEHLIGLGHRRIAFLIGAEQETSAVEERLIGYRRALADAGLQADPLLAMRVASAGDAEVPIIAPEARSALVRVTQPPHCVTAFVGCHDRVALAALRALRAAGLRVPQDVAVTGFNNYAWAATTEVPLTTVAPCPWDELGARAARLTLERLEHPGGEPRREVLPVRLIVRGSTVVGA
ncbi:MAG: substrate-binding domain-containing protein [Chloroflexota bacterium]